MRWRAGIVARPVELRFAVQHPAQEDCELLGSLMLDAYRGTIDERHKTVAEAAEHIAKYFNGDFGKVLPDCSYMAIDAGRPVSVTLVSLDCDEPLLAQAYTAPAWQCRGLASALIQMSMNTLAEKGSRALNLVVTAGNAPAEHVYRKLGFEPFSRGDPALQQQPEIISP